MGAFFYAKLTYKNDLVSVLVVFNYSVLASITSEEVLVTSLIGDKAPPTASNSSDVTRA